MAEATPDALEQRNRELSILNVIAQALNRQTELVEALQTTLHQVVELFNLHTAWIWLVEENNDQFYLAASLHLPPALAESPRRMQGWCYCQELYDAGDLDEASNVSVIQCTRLKGLSKGTDGLLNHASVPLYAHGKRLGILNVVSSDWRELTLDELRLLYTVGDMLSIAIERARLFANSTRLGALEERNRLAREIHDTLAQGLAATSMQLETAEVLLESGGDSEKLRRAVERALQLTRQNLEEARRSVLDLRAEPLEGKTLAEALSTLAQEVTENAGLKLRYASEGNVHSIPLRIEIGLYRIAQEALTNVVRHARASKVTIKLNAENDTVALIIEDDGQGFDPDQVSAGRFGLIGINERARLLGGSANLCSEPGEGTALEVNIPLEDEPIRRS
ncbi:MAG: GAF domain-containing sensor histidine kinase [Anaerolineae bacterium]|nr:GAF domain-containing sensor histidine kinase [Anaerolineae bacterium]